MNDVWIKVKDGPGPGEEFVCADDVKGIATWVGSRDVAAAPGQTTSPPREKYDRGSVLRLSDRSERTVEGVSPRDLIALLNGYEDFETMKESGAVRERGNLLL